MRKFRLYIRALSDLYEMGKKYYLLFFIQKSATQSMPFVGYIYMTRIVGALTMNQIDTIWPLIIQFLVISFVLQVIIGISEPLVMNEESMFTRKMYAKPAKKMLRMHFHYAESSEVREQLELINQTMLSNSCSLPVINMRLKEIIPHMLTIGWSVTLLYPLFSVNTEQLPNHFWWLHPVTIIVGFSIIITLHVFLQVNGARKSGKVLNELVKSARRENAIYFYEEEMLHDIKSGKEIRLYNLAHKMIELSKKSTRVYNHLFSETYKQFRFSQLPASFLFQAVSYLIYSYLGILVLFGALQVAMIVQLSNALSQMISAIPEVFQHITMMLTGPEWLERYYMFMDLPDEEASGTLPIEKRLDNEFYLAIENMSFAYPDSNKQVLQNISETFEVGKKYAIVGENGSGKTTFIKLLTRLYEPTKGQIKVNKIDIQKYDIREYFNLFGVVFQDYHLLGFSIGQNVSATPIFDEGVVLDNLDKIGLGDFVRNLPQQLHTYLGTEFDDSGVNVSGGQGQKLAIARSLYKDAPIMILDEPTAALDPLTEFEIYQNFDNLVEDKTAFYISHRLSSSKFCDEILVFDKGEIVERGTHEQLVDKGGKYQELWTAQAQYYQ